MTGYETAAVEQAATERLDDMDEARWELDRHAAQRAPARTADARDRFLADGDEQSPDDPLWLAFQTALAQEMRLRREYFDAFGAAYDDAEGA